MDHHADVNELAQTAKTLSVTDNGKKLDDTFFIQDVYFEVQHTIFKVHKHDFMANSKVFRDMFLVAQANTTEGHTLDNPIRLDSVDVDDFRQLLKVMYPSLSNIPNLKSAVPQWIAVLKLATMWELGKQRKIAITRLSSKTEGAGAAERVMLSLKYHVRPWLVPALHELVRREEPMNLIDYEIMGPQTTLKICKIRERYQHGPNCSRVSYGIETKRFNMTRQEHNFTEDIEEVFAEEIADLAGVTVQNSWFV